MASGGIIIVPICSIKEQWVKIKERVLDRASQEYYKTVEAWPDNIETLSAESIVSMFGPFKSCDCPCLSGDYIVFAEGDNIEENQDFIAHVMWGVKGAQYIETWT